MRKKTRSDGQETRKQLLAAASEVFAARGFRDATLAQICRRAGANIAAANYHFGNKETLYVESWRYAFEQALLTYPPDGGVPENASVEVRLKGRILAIMRRIIDPQSHDLDIVFKETANPSGLLTDVIPKALEPVFSGLIEIIREVLGPGADEKQVLLCLMSIRAQCFGPMMNERRRKLASPGAPLVFLDPTMNDVETLADHVTAFSLAGMRAMLMQSDHSNTSENNENLDWKTRSTKYGHPSS